MDLVHSPFFNLHCLVKKKRLQSHPTVVAECAAARRDLFLSHNLQGVARHASQISLQSRVALLVTALTIICLRVTLKGY